MKFIKILNKKLTKLKKVKTKIRKEDKDVTENC